jgi:hypothetical protein
MLFLLIEIQEGGLRMARKKYVNEYEATTACTLHLIEGCISKEHVGQVTAYTDSWFCGYETADRSIAERVRS